MKLMKKKVKKMTYLKSLIKKGKFRKKYYASDIFNTDPNYPKATTTKQKSRVNHPTLEHTKEDVFNVGKERRIVRNKEKKENENNQVLSRSVERRKKNYENNSLDNKPSC